MNVNNLMYKLFKEMKEGYASNNKDQLEHGVRCWLDLNPENPFPENSPEMEAFFQMQRCYMIWKRGDIDRKINWRKMLVHANELCALNPKQPYKFDKKAEDEEIRAALEAQKAQEEKKEEAKKEVQEIRQVLREEPLRVSGVLPEEKKSWLKNLFSWKKEGETNDGT